jgi:hypothetical protein
MGIGEMTPGAIERLGRGKLMRGASSISEVDIKAVI